MPTGDYIYQPSLLEDSFEAALAKMRRRFPQRKIETGHTPFNTREVCQAVKRGTSALGLPVEAFRADSRELEVYLRRADYTGRYESYYSFNRKEKSFEHFVALKLLAPAPGEVFVDIASERSPLPEIASRLHGCIPFGQDIMYPAGVHPAGVYAPTVGFIGGDACAMPVDDGFMSCAALTCSLEHFEGDADTRLFHELARVLRPGGRVVVVPLYTFTSPVAMTDPRYSVSVEVDFDEGVPLYCAEWGNRHGRFYSPETLESRVIAPLRGLLDFKLFEIGPPFVVDYDDTSIYARFALLATRR